MGLLLGSYSPLRAVDKLPIALDALRRGETDANTVLQIARDVYASGADYNRVFNEVMAITQTLRQDTDSGSTGTGVSAQMQSLIDERDRLQAEKDEAERFQTASSLAQLVAQLSTARGEDFSSIAELLGFTLEDFMEDLRFDSLDDLTEYLTQLVDDQNSIARLFETPTAGDIILGDRLAEIRDALIGDEGRLSGNVRTALLESQMSRDAEEQEHRDEMLEALERVVERLEQIAQVIPETSEETQAVLEDGFAALEAAGFDRGSARDAARERRKSR